MPILMILLLWPLLEIAGFAWIGGAIGVVPTLALVVLSFLAGLSVLRTAGLRTLMRLHAGARTGETPVAAALEGAWRILAGLLLVVPGFFSSALALLLLIPPVQRLLTLLLGQWLRTSGRMQIMVFGGEARPPVPAAIDGEFREVPPDRPQLPRQG
jgi:UPF0716 protein FxsA